MHCSRFEGAQSENNLLQALCDRLSRMTIGIMPMRVHCENVRRKANLSEGRPLIISSCGAKCRLCEKRQRTLDFHRYTNFIRPDVRASCVDTKADLHMPLPQRDMCVVWARRDWFIPTCAKDISMRDCVFGCRESAPEYRRMEAAALCCPARSSTTI
jgi:hypothetical protein